MLPSTDGPTLRRTSETPTDRAADDTPVPTQRAPRSSLTLSATREEPDTLKHAFSKRKKRFCVAVASLASMLSPLSSNVYLSSTLTISKVKSTTISSALMLDWLADCNQGARCTYIHGSSDNNCVYGGAGPCTIVLGPTL